MINKKDPVRLNGIVTETGTGTFAVTVSEFYVDGAWHKLKEDKVLNFNIGEDDYDDALTSLELAYVKKVADKESKNTALSSDDIAIAQSISKKLGGADV